MEPKRSQPNRDDVVDLAEVFRILVQKWWVWVLGLIIGAAAVFSYCTFLVTPEYASTAKLYVLNKEESETNTSQDDVQAGSSLATDYLAIISSRPIFETVRKKLNLDMSYETFSKKVTVNNPSDTRILEITVQDPNAKEAKRIADCTATVAARFISVKMDQDPPNLIQKGYIDGKPVSPNTKRNTTVGGMIGLLVCAAALIIRYLHNDKIEVPDDVENKIGIPVLGSLPLEDGKISEHRHRKKGRGGDKR